jgi:hypothetical protein
MRPGQVTPNDFELRLLRLIQDKDRSIRGLTDRLHVLSREYTGVGSYTTFKLPDASVKEPKRRASLDALIKMPGVPNGMGAVLLLSGNDPECLEVYTYGSDLWDGVHEGFSIESGV